MPNIIQNATKWIGQIIVLGLSLFALGIVAQVLFGNGTTFLKSDLIGNLMGLINVLGDSGLPGLIAVGIILWLFSKARARR